MPAKKAPKTKKITKAQARTDLYIELRSADIVLSILAKQTKNKGHLVEMDHLRLNMRKAIRLLDILAPK